MPFTPDVRPGGIGQRGRRTGTTQMQAVLTATSSARTTTASALRRIELQLSRAGYRKMKQNL
jgi:hypothetical protein